MGKIQVLVCTSTLAWGVNLPCHLVVVKGTEYFDGKIGGYVDSPVTDVLQMMGRAGRPQVPVYPFIPSSCSSLIPLFISIIALIRRFIPIPTPYPLSSPPPFILSLFHPLFLSSSHPLTPTPLSPSHLFILSLFHSLTLPSSHPLPSPQFDDTGVACIMVHEPKKNFYKKFLHEPFPVESSLHHQLHDHLNAEIANSTVGKYAIIPSHYFSIQSIIPPSHLPIISLSPQIILS